MSPSVTPIPPVSPVSRELAVHVLACVDALDAGPKTRFFEGGLVRRDGKPRETNDQTRGWNMLNGCTLSGFWKKVTGISVEYLELEEDPHEQAVTVEVKFAGALVGVALCLPNGTYRQFPSSPSVKHAAGVSEVSLLPQTVVEKGVSRQVMPAFLEIAPLEQVEVLVAAAPRLHALKALLCVRLHGPAFEPVTG